MTGGNKSYTMQNKQRQKKKNNIKEQIKTAVSSQ